MAATLGERPTAAVFEVEELIREVWSGRIRIPEFQRPIRWGFEDVRRLFESILREYPLGSLLLWGRPAEQESLRLGALVIDAPKTDRALWVVDGQQRITALANALSEEGAKDDRFGVSVNIVTGAVVRTTVGADSTVIPLPVLFDLTRLLQWFRDHPDAEQHFASASEIASKIRRVKIPASVVETQDVEVLRDIFDRLNNYGKRLTRAEVFAALHPGKDEDGQSPEASIESIAGSIDANLAFGTVDGDTILRAVLARRGADITREIRREFDDDRRGSSEFPGEGVVTAYRQAEKALEAAIDFLVQDAGVPHFAFLPYRYLLTVLTRVFAHHEVSGLRERQLLRRWFWRAAAAGPTTGSTTGTARMLCSQVVPGDLEATLDQLLQSVSDRPGYPDVRGFRTNYATGKIITCAMWSMEPRSLRTTQVIDRADLAIALEDAQTPRGALTTVISRRALPSDESSSVGRWLLSPGLEATPAEAATILSSGPGLAVDADDWSAVLASHGITAKAEAALLVGNDVEFLRERTRQIDLIVHTFLDSRWELGFENTVSLDHFVIDDLEVDEEVVPENERRAPTGGDEVPELA